MGFVVFFMLPSCEQEIEGSSVERGQRGREAFACPRLSSLHHIFPPVASCYPLFKISLLESTSPRGKLPPPPPPEQSSVREFSLLSFGTAVTLPSPRAFPCLSLCIPENHREVPQQERFRQPHSSLQPALPRDRLLPSCNSGDSASSP